MMIRQRPLLTVSVFAAMILVAAATYADDSGEPKRVLMTKNALSAEQAKTAQKAWADHLGVDAVGENSIGMQLSLIPPGTFPMGKENQKGKDGPQEVTHSQAYFIGRYEVTQGEWERVMGPLRWQRNRGAGDRFPIYSINYAEAAEFCRKLTQLERKAGKLPEGYQYRLPTSAEWEYACRAGTLTATYMGDKLTSRQANFNGSYPLNKAEKGPNLGRTAEVGSYPGNAWGLHDTYGNLYEWCLDWFHAILKGGVDPVHLLPAPERPLPERVRRGGCHSQAGRYCRSSNRYYHIPETRDAKLGSVLSSPSCTLMGSIN
jgi:formylglycine-generating enzyme